MKKEKDLTISAPRTGIAQSPHVGVADIRNLDIFSVPGVVKLNNILEIKGLSATVDAQVKWIVKNPASPANIYALDVNGVVYNSADSGATWAELADKSGSGQGLAVWKNYLFVVGATTLETYGPLSSSPNWLSFQTDVDTDTLWHPTLISKLDGKLYIGAGKYVASLEEVSGQNFADGDAGTYTWTPRHLDLPEDYRVKCLAEQGNNLMIGTWQGTSIYDNKIADIFPWDRSSASFGQPVQMVENGVNAMINIGGYLHIIAGIDGNIYKSNGVQANQIAHIPLSVADISSGKYFEPYPGAMINFKGRPFFGVSSASTDGMGIYSLLETSKGTILNHEHSISTLTTGGTNPVIIGALLGVTRDKLAVGWRDNATYGIDITNTASYLHTTAYTKAYFDSPLYTVGTLLNPRTYTQLELQLAKELATGEGIQIKYRVNLTDSFTTIGTYIYSGTVTTTTEIIGAVTSHNTTATIPSCEMIQIRVEMLGTATTTPHFKSLILK